MEQKEKGYGAISVEEILTLLWRKLWLLVLAALVLGGAVFALMPHETTVDYTAQQELLVLENRVWDSMLYPDLKAARTVMLSNSVLDDTIAASGLDLSEAELRGMLSVTTGDNALIRVRIQADTEEEASALMDAYLSVACPAVETTMESMTVKAAGVPSLGRTVRSSGALKYGLFAAVAGAVLMALVLIYRELFDRRIKDEKTAALCTGLLVLGVIPELPGDRGKKGDTPHTLDGADLPYAYTEAFRSLRANLDAQLDGAVKSLTIVGAGANEDVYNTALNLAIALGRLGKRVTVVDCDLAGGNLAAWLPGTKDKGMTELLNGAAQTADCLAQTPWQGVSAIAAGKTRSAGEELLNDAALRKAITALETDCDVLLLIAPPAALTADAAVLSAAADGTVLVLRARHSLQETAKLAEEKLSTAGGRLLGAVLTRLDSKRVYSRNGYVQAFKETYPKQ